MKRESQYTYGALAGAWIIYLILVIPRMRSGSGLVAGDFSYFLPRLLAGYYWQHVNGIFSVPWFTPAFCGGLPDFPNPQSITWSLPELLTHLVNPWRAVIGTVAIESALGVIGAYVLLRSSFGTSQPAAALGAVIFLFNSFFSARMLAGHLAFHAFMLLPWAAYLLLHRLLWPLAPLVPTVMLLSGMSVALPPTMIALAAIGFIHGGGWKFVGRLAIACALFVMISAPKIEAASSFLSNVHRDFYELPGFSNPPAAIWIAFKELFLWGSPADGAHVIISGFTLGSGEWQYGVGPVPLILILLGLIQWWRAARPRMVWIFAAAIVLAVPLIVNIHAAALGDLLKGLPGLRNSSSLMRWFAAYIPVAVVVAALAADRAFAASRARWIACGVGIAATILWHAGTDRTPEDRIYNPAHMTNAWTAVKQTGRVPPITHVPWSARRALDSDDGFALGGSTVPCYEPLFGYFGEAFPVQLYTSSTYYLKEPIHYLAPASPSRSWESEESLFAAYRPIDFQISSRQRIAEAGSLVGLLIMLGLLAAPRLLRHAPVGRGAG